MWEHCPERPWSLESTTAATMAGGPQAFWRDQKEEGKEPEWERARLTDQELHLTSHLILCTSKPVLCTEKCNIIYFYHCCSLIIPGSQSTYKGIFYNTIRSPHFPFALSSLIHCHSNYSANSRTLT